jgi:hypothetical protein
MPSLYENELVQSRSSADDDGPQPRTIQRRYADLDLVEDDDEEDETVEDPHTLVELMEPPTKERRLTIVRESSEDSAAKPLLFAPPVRKGKPRSKSVTTTT